MKFFCSLLFLLIPGTSFCQPTSPKPHTASVNVTILDTAFPAPQLHTTKRIWIYLPASYARGKTRYPVIYMPDGQDLFDSYTCRNEEWGVDECLDSLIRNGKPAAIVVAIESDTGIRKYGPDDTKPSEKIAGDSYLDFLVKELKPFIDKHYRTLPSKENTIIAGSSMGGLMAYDAMITYPDCFGKAGIFSPSFDSIPAMNHLTDSVAGKLTGKYFFYIGGQEGDSAINNLETIREKIGKNSSAIIYSVIDPDGQHNEQAWRKWFAEFYGWIMAEGFNNVIRVEK